MDKNRLELASSHKRTENLRQEESDLLKTTFLLEINQMRSIIEVRQFLKKKLKRVLTSKKTLMMRFK